LQGYGVTAALDLEGRVRFSFRYRPSIRAQRLIETHGDLVQARLAEIKAALERLSR
jgi:hypothetical protein